MFPLSTLPDTLESCVNHVYVFGSAVAVVSVVHFFVVSVSFNSYVPSNFSV